MGGDWAQDHTCIFQWPPLFAWTTHLRLIKLTRFQQQKGGTGNIFYMNTESISCKCQFTGQSYLQPKHAVFGTAVVLDAYWRCRYNQEYFKQCSGATLKNWTVAVTTKRYFSSSSCWCQDCITTPKDITPLNYLFIQPLKLNDALFGSLAGLTTTPNFIYNVALGWFPLTHSNV